MDCSLEKLEQTPSLHPFVKKVDRLLKVNPQRDLGRVLLTAVQWVGRGSVETRREEAFLLLSIALESIVLPVTDTELSYRLRVRTAHLLGRTIGERTRISKEIRELYRMDSPTVVTIG
jgi:hypothetical protein